MEILYAPNINSGGGFVLLKSLIEQWPFSNPIYVILDNRCKNEFNKSNLANIEVLYWVKPNIFSWILSEVRLFLIKKTDDFVLCFHNLPPLFCNSSNVFIYFQNRLIIENNLNNMVGQKRKFLIILERIIILLFYKPKHTYITQTESIRNILFRKLNKSMRLWGKHKLTAPQIKVIPFFAHQSLSSTFPASGNYRWDFIYVSSGEPYKNHLNLIEAWILLSEEGFRPSLAVTLDPNHYPGLVKQISTLKKHLRITNLGQIPHEDILMEYTHSKALIFPSDCESLSQPLIEARDRKIPIIASERDFVRDICDPAETFDPNSPLSIARAVKRFLKAPVKHQDIISSEYFWRKLLDK